MATIGTYPGRATSGTQDTDPLPIVGQLGTPVVGAAVSAAAPAAGTVVGDTGPLAAGTYRIKYVAAGSGVLAAGVHMEFQHRNAANSANIQAGPICPMGGSVMEEIPKVVVAANERFRFITVGTPAASSVYGARIDATPLPTGA